MVVENAGWCPPSGCPATTFVHPCPTTTLTSRFIITATTIITRRRLMCPRMQGEQCRMVPAVRVPATTGPTLAPLPPSRQTAVTIIITITIDTKSTCMCPVMVCFNSHLLQGYGLPLLATRRRPYGRHQFCLVATWSCGVATCRGWQSVSAALPRDTEACAHAEH